MSASYDSGLNDDADLYLSPRPFERGTIVHYYHKNHIYRGNVMDAGFHVLLVESEGECHYICYGDIIQVEKKAARN